MAAERPGRAPDLRTLGDVANGARNLEVMPVWRCLLCTGYIAIPILLFSWVGRQGPDDELR